MVERSDQIREQIDAQRGALGENLHELERRVKSTTDWRAQMDKRPWVMLGAAFGAGIAVSSLIGRSPSSYSYGSSYNEAPSYSNASSSYNTGGSSTRFTNIREQKSRATEALDKMTGALIAVGVQKLQDILGDTVPGFRDKFAQHQGQDSAENESYQRGGYDPNRADAYEPSPTI